MQIRYVFRTNNGNIKEFLNQAIFKFYSRQHRSDRSNAKVLRNIKYCSGFHLAQRNYLSCHEGLRHLFVYKKYVITFGSWNVLHIRVKIISVYFTRRLFSYFFESSWPQILTSLNIFDKITYMSNATIFKKGIKNQHFVTMEDPCLIMIVYR